MHVTSLGLVDFRSYATMDLALSPGITTIIGANGQGKTNLVEALGYAATLRSHRVATDAPLVRQGAQRAVVRTEVAREGRRVLIELEITAGRANRARVNRAPVNRPRDVLGHLSRVLFAPEDLSLVKGDPSERRALLDELLVALAPRYDAVIADLDRVLRQRNALLRSAGALRSGGARAREAAEQTLGVWDEQLAGLAAELTIARARLVQRLSGPLTRRYAEVAPAGSLPRPEARYIPGTRGLDPGALVSQVSREDVAQEIREALAARRDEEFARGLTLVGPHRDEVVLSLGELPVRGYASQGESWSMALGLRLASYDIQRDVAGPGGDPVLILDDVLAELDAGRRERLAHLVADVEQVLVTAAVESDVPAALTGHVVEVSDGTARGVR